jgi:flagellar motor switch protein FliG
MSQRARERVEEEREMAGRVPVSEVETARDEIMKVARRMYRDGDLVVEMGDEQYVE